MQEIVTKLSHYLLTPASPDSRFVVAGMVVSVLILVIGLFSRMFNRRWRQQRRSTLLTESVAALAILLRLFGGLWFVLFFLRYQGIVPFTVRAWVYATLIPAFVWAIVVLRSFRNHIPDRAAEDERYNKYEKYLPKSKKLARR